MFQDANNPEAEQQLATHHKEKMASLSAETEQQLLTQSQQLHICDASLKYLRSKSELCAEHAKVCHCAYTLVSNCPRKTSNNM